MKNTVKWLNVVAALPLAFAASVSVAEPLDGAKILEMEAEKARQIEDLEYQAKLIEQKAKLAKAYQKLKESGGVIPGEEGMAFEGSATPAESNTPAGEASLNKLPTLKSIGSGYAVFEHRGKLFRAVPGGSLPGGFKVLSISDSRGVRLQQGGNIYALDIAWASTSR